MQAALENVPIPKGSSLRYLWAPGEQFVPVWHFHSECELMLVERSRGLRFIGDCIEPFQEGDLVLVGPNLPHAWMNHEAPAPREIRYNATVSILIQFRTDFLGSTLWKSPEFSPIRGLLQLSRRGVHFYGDCARKAAEHMRRIGRLGGAERIAEVLRLLDGLARTRQRRILSIAGYVPVLKRSDERRLRGVCHYVRERFTRKISLTTAAGLAGLGPAQFSAYFHRKMGRTFSAYVTEMRLRYAVRLMMNEKISISEACFASGFSHLAHFNQRFRAAKGMSPRVFLHHFQTCVGPENKWLVRSQWVFENNQTGLNPAH